MESDIVSPGVVETVDHDQCKEIKTKHFPFNSSNKVPNYKKEVKFKPQKQLAVEGNKGSAKSKTNGKTNSNSTSILKFFKPVSGATSTADNRFYPPD